MELLWCTDAGASSFWYSSNSVERRTVADDDGYHGWSEVLRTLCGSALSYLQLPTGKHSLCLDLTVFGLPVRVRMQSDAVKTAGILCIIGIGIGIGLTSWLVCKLHGPAGRSHGRAFRWGRDAHSAADIGSRRSRSLVSTSKSLAVSILPPELFSVGLARRRRQALESDGDVEADAHDASAEVSVLIDTLDDDDVTAVSGSSREARQWLRDETFVDRRVHGPMVQHGRQSQTTRSSTSDLLGWGRHCQTSTSGLDMGTSLSDVISSGASLCSAAERGQMPWHSALAALSNVPSMQSSTRDSGFLEWVPGDMQQSTEDERLAALLQLNVAAARSSCDSEAATNSKCQDSSQTCRQSNVVGPDWAWTVADNHQPTLPDTCSPLCRANTRSVEAWLTQQQKQQQQTHWPCSSATSADCANLPPYGMHIDASTVARKNAVAGSASVSVASVVAGDEDVLLLAEDVCSVKTVQTALQGMRVRPDAPHCEAGALVGREISCKRDHNECAAAAAAASAGISPAVFSRAILETLNATSELAGGCELTDADSDRTHSETGPLLPGECSDSSLSGRQSHAAGMPWSPASDLTFESWTDDLPSYSACSSDVTSPVHSAASYTRCCRSCGSTVASVPCPSGGPACACALAGDNRSASPATSSLADFDRSTPCVDGPDTVERLSAIETELSILKSEMSEIEQCLRGLIVRDSFDNIYSPERYRKLTRVVLESDHVAGLTSAEIGKAFDILRKYRPGRAATRDDFSRGSSWPDESGPQERRNSFSDSPRRSKDLALRELVYDAGVSSDDELAGRRNSCLPVERAGGATLRKAPCIKSSSSLTNLAAMASPSGTVCAAVPYVRSFSRSPHLQNEQCEGTRTQAKGSASEGDESECRHRSAVFHGLKLINVAAARKPNATSRFAESDIVAKGLESISEEMGLSRICSVEGSIDCCALRAVLIGALLAQLPLTPRLRQAVGIFKTLGSPSLITDAMSTQHLSGDHSQADRSSSADENTVILSLLAEANQEVRVLEECLARHAGNASRQHDVEMLSDLLLGVFNDRDRDEIVLNALEVVMTLRACRLSTAYSHQRQHLNGYKPADRCADAHCVLESPDRFWREILGRRNDKGQRRRLETVDLCTLAESLGCILLLLRPSRYGQADFATYFPAMPKSDDGACGDHCTETPPTPIVSLLTDDDEHYSVALS